VLADGLATSSVPEAKEEEHIPGSHHKRKSPLRSFPFEHDVDNVRRASTDMGVAYPIAVDSDFAVWSAVDNHYWPALYIADAQGQLRHHHFGEGAYDQAISVRHRSVRL